MVSHPSEWTEDVFKAALRDRMLRVRKAIEVGDSDSVASPSRSVQLSGDTIALLENARKEISEAPDKKTPPRAIVTARRAHGSPESWQKMKRSPGSVLPREALWRHESRSPEHERSHEAEEFVSPREEFYSPALSATRSSAPPVTPGEGYDDVKHEKGGGGNFPQVTEEVLYTVALDGDDAKRLALAYGAALENVKHSLDLARRDAEDLRTQMKRKDKLHNDTLQTIVAERDIALEDAKRWRSRAHENAVASGACCRNTELELSIARRENIKQRQQMEKLTLANDTMQVEFVGVMEECRGEVETWKLEAKKTSDRAQEAMEHLLELLAEQCCQTEALREDLKNLERTMNEIPRTAVKSDARNEGGCRTEDVLKIDDLQPPKEPMSSHPSSQYDDSDSLFGLCPGIMALVEGSPPKSSKKKPLLPRSRKVSSSSKQNYLTTVDVLASSQQLQDFVLSHRGSPGSVVAESVGSMDLEGPRRTGYAFHSFPASAASSPEGRGTSEAVVQQKKPVDDFSLDRPQSSASNYAGSMNRAGNATPQNFAQPPSLSGTSALCQSRVSPQHSSSTISPGVQRFQGSQRSHGVGSRYPEHNPASSLMACPQPASTPRVAQAQHHVLSTPEKSVGHTVPIPADVSASMSQERKSNAATKKAGRRPEIESGSQKLDPNDSFHSMYEDAVDRSNTDDDDCEQIDGGEHEVVLVPEREAIKVRSNQLDNLASLLQTTPLITTSSAENLEAVTPKLASKSEPKDLLQGESQQAKLVREFLASPSMQKVEHLDRMLETLNSVLAVTVEDVEEDTGMAPNTKSMPLEYSPERQNSHTTSAEVMVVDGRRGSFATVRDVEGLIRSLKEAVEDDPTTS